MYMLLQKMVLVIQEKSFTTADGTTIKGVVDYVAFAIKNVKFVKQNVYVQNATYAGGLPVKPSVLVQINGNTLVEGKDYTLTLKANGHNDPSGVNFVKSRSYRYQWIYWFFRN